MFVLSQIFIVISGILFALSYLLKKKGLILIVNFFNNVFFATHFLLLKSFTASYTIFVIAFFLVAVYYLEKHKKQKTIFLALAISLVLVLIISCFTWENILSLIPATASALTLIGSIIKKPLLVKLFYLTSTMLNTIFMFVIHSYFGFAINIGILVVAFVGIYLHLKAKKV